MMNILMLDDRPDHVGSKRVFIKNLSSALVGLGYECDLNNELNSTYDVVVLGKNNIGNVKKFRKKLGKNILLGIANPPASEKSVQISQHVDFCIAGSHEERDSLLKYYDNCIYYPLIETMFSKTKIHENKKKIVIGYHGNMEHLACFEPNLKWAVEKFSETNDVLLKVIYGNHNDKNIAGSWIIGKPAVDVEECRWSIDSIEKELLECDIGVVPNNIYISDREKEIFFRSNHPEKPGRYDSDYLLRFKNKSNIGRALVFVQLGIPVIGDMIPSHFSLFDDPRNGCIAYSKEGWLNGLERLKDYRTRVEISTNAKNSFDEKYNINEWAKYVYDEIAKIWMIKQGG